MRLFARSDFHNLLTKDLKEIGKETSLLWAKLLTRNRYWTKEQLADFVLESDPKEKTV